MVLSPVTLTGSGVFIRSEVNLFAVTTTSLRVLERSVSGKGYRSLSCPERNAKGKNRKTIKQNFRTTIQILKELINYHFK
jgi:hypothetical protein